MGCKTKNPLVRDGVSQNQRLLKALNPAYAKVDERNLADILYFLVDYAREVNYFSIENKIEGDWKPFLEKDITVIISLIAKKDAFLEKSCYEKTIKIIQDPASTEEEVEVAFKALLNLMYSIFYEFDNWYKETAKGLGIQKYLKQVIRSQLKTNLNKFISFYKGALPDPPVYDPSILIPDDFCDLTLIDIDQIESFELLDVWFYNEDGSGYDDWSSFYSSIPENKNIYGPDRDDPLVDNSLKIRESLDKFFLIFEDLYDAIKQAIFKTDKYAEETLTKYSSHEPHMGLILSFLQLFKYAQNNINSITKRHLDFYYQQVLKLEKLKAVPDKVHLIFELAKHIEEHKIGKGILLKAGKDNLGNDVLYEILDEAIINKASIDWIRSIYIDKEDKWRIYASPVSNSVDGQGTEFDDEDPKWKAFGESQKGISSKDRTMPGATTGFALTSPLLLLSEGLRSIGMIVTFKNPMIGSAFNLSKLFNISLTGEEDWISLSDNPNSHLLVLGGGKILFVVIILDKGVPPISNYQTKIHGTNYDTSFPIIRFIAKNDQPDNHINKILRNCRIDQIQTYVAGNGIKNLILQNEHGVLDPAKPFRPFGPTPVKASRFYLGSHEVFKKDLAFINLKIKWHNLPITSVDTDNNPICDFNTYYNYKSLQEASEPKYDPQNQHYKTDVEILDNGTWKNIYSDTAQKINLFNTSNAFIDRNISILKTNSNLDIGHNPDLDKFTKYSVDDERGFIRLSFEEPNVAFGHKLYTRLYVQEVSKNPIGTLPVEPYTPEISEISLDYISMETLDLSSTDNFSKRTTKLFQIHPFGIEEVHKKLTGDDLFLLPQFKHSDKGLTISHQGELLLGIKDLDPPQNISILFHVAEGSEDPSLSKQPIAWFYLSSNKWIKFGSDEILSDETNDLLTTGIIKFRIPSAADTKNTILETGYHWIKGTLSEKTAAVCDVMYINPQALVASFKDNNNDPDFLATPIEKETISKLKVKEAEIKSISQPYSSFGGKVKETNIDYYIRVSERLRHKSRGITIWDYERLILQEFPEVYKAKCINHSTYDYEEKPGKIINSEFAPGFVTVIVVPDLKNQNAVLALEPRLSLNTLDEIKKYLSKIISPFAAEKLKVINPMFEKIMVEFYVKFHKGFDEGYYKKQAKEDIKKFLSPWAYEEGKDIIFGGKIHKSVILNFVEERPYVDFVTDFKMNHIINSIHTDYDVDEAVATSARSVIVSNYMHIIYETSSCS